MGDFIHSLEAIQRNMSTIKKKSVKKYISDMNQGTNRKRKK